MPAKTPQFGTFVFDEATGIFNSSMREMSPAERDLTILGRAGSAGMSILRSRRKGKTVIISGIMLQTSSADLITAIRDMSKNLMAEESGGLPTADLQFTNEKGTWIYAGAILLNPDSLFPNEEAQHISWIPFQAVFFCPTGVPRSVSATTVNFDNITSAPNADSITISGTVSPDVLIAITFDIVDTITEFTFTNTTVNEQIKVSGLSMSDGDTVYIDNENQEVRVNATKVAFDGIFPTFLPGKNNWQLTVAGDNNITEEQTTYDDVEQVFGNNWISQEFKAGNEDIAQIALFLKKISGVASAIYDLFDDNNFNNSLWTQTGLQDAIEQNQRLEFSTNAPNSNTVTSDETDFDGVIFTTGHLSGGSSGETSSSHYAAINGNGLNIRIYMLFNDGTSTIRIDGADVKTVGGLNHTWDIRRNGSDTEIYMDSVLQHTVSAKTFDDAAKLEIHNAPPAGTQGFYVDSIHKYTQGGVNSDITVEIQTDTAGKPSGSVVTNGTLTIPASSVSDSFGQILAAFATAPTLTAATIYHLVVNQVGGDVDNYFEARKNTAGGYDDGNLERSDDAGSSWTTVGAEDLWFKLWTTLPSSFNIDIAMTYNESHYGVI